MAPPGSGAGSLDAAAAVRAVVEAYAAGVDARRYDDVAALFTPDGELRFRRAPGAEARPTVGRVAVAAALTGLDRYAATMHVLGNHRCSVAGPEADAVTHCLAHHVEAVAGEWSVWLLAVRYEDHLVLADGAWRFARRELQPLWSERRPVER